MSDLKIMIDRTKCTGEAICVGIAPEVFDLDEDGIAVVVGSEGANREAVLEAAESCPADAIMRTADGIVHSARKPRCVACNNCVLACPFGIPKMQTEMHLMMKCDMCYDRSSAGKKPMCASVCPSQALFFGTRAEIEKLRVHSCQLDTFQFGGQSIQTRVQLMVPQAASIKELDIISAIYEPTITHEIEDDLFLASVISVEAHA